MDNPPTAAAGRTALLSIQPVLTLVGKIKPWVTGGQLNVFQKMAIIKSIAVQKCEESKGGKLQCDPDCSPVFCYSETKGQVTSLPALREGYVFTKAVTRSELQLGM